MTFQSILFQSLAQRKLAEQKAEPDFFVDLNLDQIVAGVTRNKQEYDLKPFFYTPLHDVDTICFRQEVMQDLENPHLISRIKSFAEAMREMRKKLALVEGSSYEHEQERWFLDAVDTYCDAVVQLAHDLSVVKERSLGLNRFHEYLTEYLDSEPFTFLLSQTKKIKQELSAIRYHLLINGINVQVSKCTGEPDYSAEIEETFINFNQGDSREYAFKFINSEKMNRVEAEILDLVVQLYPDLFLELASYCITHQSFRDEDIVTFDREIQFYVAYLEYTAALNKAELRFCYPQIVAGNKKVSSSQSFDLALADKLKRAGSSPICNDFYLQGSERIIVVSGPNQGGKTTFARTFGQLHYLASLGCPVPGSNGQLYLFDQLFTHFEKEESVVTLQGKLADDLVRMRTILDSATPKSIIIINEIFASTTVKDAIILSKKVAAMVMELDLFCVWVTFIDELASLGEQTVSMVSMVIPENPGQRTYKIVRQPANGLAYALVIAEKHQLTYEKIKERISS